MKRAARINKAKMTYFVTLKGLPFKKKFLEIGQNDKIPLVQ